VVLEKALESPLDSKDSNQSILKDISPEYSLEGQQLEPDMEQRTGSKLGKESVKAVYCHPAYLTYIWSTSYKILG